MGDEITEPARKGLELARGLTNRFAADFFRAEEEKKKRAAEDAEKLNRRNLSPPSVIAQVHEWHCWAAASSSWVMAVDGRSWSKDYFIRRFANAPDGALNALEPNRMVPGTQRPTAAFNRLAAELRLTFKHMSGKALLPEFVAEKLENHKYLLLFYPIDDASTVAHTVVVYGINHPGPGPFALNVMDPFGPGLVVKPLGYFQGRSSVILGWSAVSTK